MNNKPTTKQHNKMRKLGTTTIDLISNINNTQPKYVSGKKVTERGCFQTKQTENRKQTNTNEKYSSS